MIQILSHINTIALLKKEPNKHAVIFITSDSLVPIEGTEELPQLAKSFLRLEFEDSVDVDTGPHRDDVVGALEFSVWHKSLIVSCRAGVSRSAGIAYVIESHRTDPTAALGILDERLHFPNELVVELGANILGKMEMIPLIKKFHDRSSDALSPAEWQAEAMKRQFGMQ